MVLVTLNLQTTEIGGATDSRVYDSNRAVSNVELMQIAQKTHSNPPKQSALCKDVLHPDRVSNIQREYDKTCKGRIESTYQVFLSWKESNGINATLGIMARKLREHGFADVAESFPP